MTDKKSAVYLFSKSDRLSFNVPNKFLEMLRQVAKNRGCRTTIVFKELVELMTEELIKELG
jgi:hypothetical protein